VSGAVLRGQVRDLPAMRAAVLAYEGPPDGVGSAFERLEAWVAEQGLFAAGPLIAAYAGLESASPVLPVVRAELMIPLTRLPPSGGDIEGRRVPSVRAACLMFDGAMDARFRATHEELFAWIDAQGLQRDGTAHHHAYIRTGSGLGHWTVEIRVPVRAGNPLEFRRS